MKIVLTMIAATTLLVSLGCEPAAPEESANPETELSSLESAGAKEVASIRIEAGPVAQTKAQEAFILAQPGDVIEFAAGKFQFDGTLSFDGINDVTVRGQGMEKTILNFSQVRAGKGGEGIKVKADNFVLEDLTIEDTPGDAIKLQDCNGLTIRRVRTWWSGGPATENGAYGLYPVLSTNVLIEHCVAEGASDAGIYVGQSKQVIVRNCRVERNVAGIEIENCIGADVHDNLANHNTGGILVFSLPGLVLKNGSNCRIFNNEMSSNNHPNFAATGAMVSAVPPGTGLMVMANDRVEVFGNRFNGNVSAGCLVVSFLATQRKYDDAEYDPYPEAIHIHDNSFADGGTDPHGEFLVQYTNATGKSAPDIVIDGIFNSEKIVDGVLPADLNFSILNNGQATFVNLDLGKTLKGEAPSPVTDPAPFGGPLLPLEAVAISGVQ